MEERVQDVLFLPSFLFSADAGVVVDMAHKPAETPVLRLARTEAAGKWHSAMRIEVLLEQGYKQFELWTRRRYPRSVVSKMALAAHHASA
jgi:pentafunctional AROM polypeptide